MGRRLLCFKHNERQPGHQVMIDRRTLFTKAWQQARRTVGQFRTLRSAFAAALRETWVFMKMMAAETARTAAIQAARAAATPQKWADQNPYRASAVARHVARLNTHPLLTRVNHHGHS